MCVFFLDSSERAGVFDMLLSAVMESESLSADDDAKDVQVDVKTATTHRLGELAAACLLSIVQDASVLHARVLPDLVGMASDDSAGEDDAADAEQDVGSLSSMTWSAIQKFNKKKLTELLAKLGTYCVCGGSSVRAAVGLSEDGTNDVLKERLRKHQLKREFVKRQVQEPTLPSFTACAASAQGFRVISSAGAGGATAGCDQIRA